MIKIYILTILLLQHTQIAQGVSCASNPCNLIAGLYDINTGYCCSNIPPYYTDSVCICPNNVQTVNAPCRSSTTLPTVCTKQCVNGGVCNIVNGQQVCYCQLGFSGEFCEIQGIQNRCYAGLCQVGNCYEQVNGITTYAYCQCLPGYRGITCNQNYFTCPAQGVYPDTTQCATGRYFFCQQINAVPAIATCPTGQRFNRFTGQCDSAYQCT